MPFSLPSFALPFVLSTFVALLPARTLAQFAPWQANNLTTIASPFDPGITISYKEPIGVCTTAFNSQKQYTGWVSVPGNHASNIFFWFVAARQPSSTLTIWINGGPGSSSMFGFFDETGPCEVVELDANHLGTVPREWGWDRASNMLFIDQPTQVGFSYDAPTNGSLDLVSGMRSVPPKSIPLDRPAQTFFNGTFSSLNETGTANTTSTAALAIWHMLQGFLGTFPQYHPPENGSIGVNLFAESYGGKYAPVFAELWEEQNEKRRNGTLANSTTDISLSALGIMNGCVDDLVQGPSYASMLASNGYNVKLANDVHIGLVNGSFYAPGGCLDLVNECRNATATADPDNTGAVFSVNSACKEAEAACSKGLLEPYRQAGRSYYDIAHELPESFPPEYYNTYLNNRTVQDAIGSIVNFTDTSYTVYSAFSKTGDWERGPMIPKLTALLKRGVRVGLIYGDRDYICNWIGGEAVSMDVASQMGGTYAARFPSAGYAPIIVNNSYIGGVVRQFGNLSFSRIYQAGHFAPAYQPETAFQVFARIILGTSISTGELVDLRVYNTLGDANATLNLKLPPSPKPTCYMSNLADSCPGESVSNILAGKGVIINGVWYEASSDWPGLKAAIATTVTGTGTSAHSTRTATLTGLFTATATPHSKGLRMSEPCEMRLLVAVGFGVIMGSWV